MGFVQATSACTSSPLSAKGDGTLASGMGSTALASETKSRLCRGRSRASPSQWKEREASSTKKRRTGLWLKTQSTSLTKVRPKPLNGDYFEEISMVCPSGARVHGSRYQCWVEVFSDRERYKFQDSCASSTDARCDFAAPSAVS